MLRNLRAFGTWPMRRPASCKSYLDQILRVTHGVLIKNDVHLHKNALLVPFMEGDELVWKRLHEIAELEIVGRDYDWNIRRRPHGRVEA